MKNTDFSGKDLIASIEDLYAGADIKLAIGWLLASQHASLLYDTYGCFPLLFITGKRESGKTTLSNWLMAMMGKDDYLGDSFGCLSITGADRLLSEAAPLPYVLDEYSPCKHYSAKRKKWNEFLCGVYRRQTSGLILAGEELPKKQDLLDCCVIITLLKNPDPTKRIDLYEELQHLWKEGAMKQFIDEIQNLPVPALIEQIDVERERLLETGLDPQAALNYAIPKTFWALSHYADSSITIKPADLFNKFHR